MAFLCVLLGAICIQSIAAKPLNDPYGWDNSGGSLLLPDDVDDGFSVNPPTNFNDNLFVQLLKNNAFGLVFNDPYSADAVNNLISCAANSIAQEFQIDAFSAMNTFYDSMAAIYQGSGPEVYASTAADSLSAIFNAYNILSAYNSFDVANRVASLFDVCTDDPNDYADDTFTDYFDDPVVDDVPNIGSGFDDVPVLGNGDDYTPRLVPNIRPGLLPNVGNGLIPNKRPGLLPNVGNGLIPNKRPAILPNIGNGLIPNKRPAILPNIGTGLVPKTRPSLLPNVGTGLVPNLGKGLLPNIGTGLLPNLGAGLLPNLGTGLGTVLNVGLDNCANADGALDVETAVPLFQQRLQKELLRDRYFRSVFVDSIPETAVSNIASAIAQFLSKAFKLPRSYLLNLERDLTAYLKGDLASPDEYADGISTSFVNLLSAANLLIPCALDVQIGMASKAITSAILNFIGTNKVAGVGLGFNNNPYNSYFSILSGLEMLPYVGPDAVSRKYPPILKAVRATNFGARFTDILASNLISNNKFSSTFLLGIPAPFWKNVARCIGVSMAEAFGSINPAFFMDVYANALLSLGERLSYKTYARVLSSATAKALYALGYFVSGNPNIQAAIAANAIIRTTENRCRLRNNNQFPTVTTNLGQPWTTPVVGVLPPDSDVANVGVGIGTDLVPDVVDDLDVGDIDVLPDVGDIVDPDDVDDAVPDDEDDDVVPDVQVPNANVPDGVGAVPRFGRKRRDLPDTPSVPIVPVDVDVPNPEDVLPDVGVGNVGVDVGVNVGDGTDVGVTSILEVLPKMLAEKLFSSTAMYTAMSLVGPRRVANLIGQAIAAQFGFPCAAVYESSYRSSITDTPDGDFTPSIISIARATTEALANAGVLADGFTILSADQLSTAIYLKYNSLIATSLDTKEWNVGPRWSYIYDQEFIAPPLARGYNYWRPNVFSDYIGSLDDTLALDYGMGSSFTMNIPANNGIPPVRGKILLK